MARITTNKKHCKNYKSLITVENKKGKYMATCNDCNYVVQGKKEVTEFLIHPDES